MQYSSNNGFIAPLQGIASHCKPLQAPLQPPWMYVSALGHISTTIAPMYLNALSSASSDAVACNTAAIMASLLHCNPLHAIARHAKAYFGCFVLSLQPPLQPPWMYVSALGHISTTIAPMYLNALSSASSDAVACNIAAIMASLQPIASHCKSLQGMPRLT